MGEQIGGVDLVTNNVNLIPTGVAQDGWDTTKGTRADAPATSATASSSEVSLAKAFLAALGFPGDAAAASGTVSGSLLAFIKALVVAAQGATPPGNNIVGKFGIDQTTAGTTNGVVVNSSALPSGGATDASLQQIVNLLKLQADIADLFVYDTTTSNPVKYYVRRDTVNEQTGAVTTSFLNLDGSTPGTAPTVANLAPATGGALAVETATYDVTTAFTGAAVGDILVRALFEIGAAGAPTSAWYNVTQGTVLGSAPSAANIVENTKNVLATVDGSDPASPPQANLGTGSRGWLATIAALLKLGTANKANSASVTIATDQGNLEPGGTAVTGATMPAGGTGLTGWISALWLLFSGGTARIQQAMWFDEGTSQSVAANGSLNGTARNNAASGNGGSYGYFTAQVSSNQAGTLVIGNGTYFQNFTVAAGTVVTGKVPAIGAQFTAGYSNGGTAATVSLRTMYSAA